MVEKGLKRLGLCELVSWKRVEARGYYTTGGWSKPNFDTNLRSLRQHDLTMESDDLWLLLLI